MATVTGIMPGSTSSPPTGATTAVPPPAPAGQAPAAPVTQAATTPAPCVPAPARPPLTELDPRPVLAAYPHIASCPFCRDYTADYLPLYPGAQVVIAVLAHHDSGHQHDPLCAASQHFAATI